jgi:hypothetical protein
MVDSDSFGATFGLVWLAISVIATLILVPTYFGHARSRGFITNHVKYLTIPRIVLLAFIARIVPVLVLNRGADFDMTSYNIVGQVVAAGHDVYTTAWVTGHYPYLPLQMWLSTGAWFISKYGHMPFVVIAKLPGALADTAIVACVSAGLQSCGVTRATALTAGLIYALNPISILVTAYHGQVNAIPFLAGMIAWYILNSTRAARMTSWSVVTAGRP